jgi:phosphatidylglycerol:prolipoprotein diacylglycerol transferase
MIQYHKIDPVIFSVGPLAVHWYGLMYVFGFGAGWLLARRRASQPDSTWKPIDVDDLIFYCALGVIVGGRVGWILFYGLAQELQDPLLIFRIWEGGMSFHGGLLGVTAAAMIFAKLRNRIFLDVADFTSPLPAIGLFTGRIGNFINGELWGKQTDVPWAFVVDGTPLHASQLYEAVLEGLVTFFIVWFYSAKPRPRGSVTGLFLLCYGVFRFGVEFVRVPDANRGYLLWGWVTEGQLLSLPVIVAGVWALTFAYRSMTPSGNLVRSAA